MSAGSREYQVLLAWIQGGAPGIDKDDPVIRRLEVSPGHSSLKAGQTLQLLVRATYSDGQSRDVTWLTKFDSNDAGVAGVSPAGLVKMERSGETAIRAMFAGQVAIAIVTAPFDLPVKAEWFAQKYNFIDEHVFQKLAELRIEPSDLCSDAVFIFAESGSLDAMGMLPTRRRTAKRVPSPTPRRTRRA